MKNKIYTYKEHCIISLSIAIVIGVILIVAGWISKSTIESNVIRRVIDESEFLSKQQAELKNNVIDEQFERILSI